MPCWGKRQHEENLEREERAWWQRRGQLTTTACTASRWPPSWSASGTQNLRLYEARGLLEPDRTEGGTRRYSANDLDRLRRIGDLLAAGLNLAGIGMVLDLEAQNTALQAEKEEQEQQRLTTAPIPATRSPKRTSSTSKPRSTRSSSR